MEMSIVIPVHNEAGNVAPLAAAIRAALDGRFEYEVIFVDDGSSDDTRRQLAQIGAAISNLRVVHLRRNGGQSAALYSGVSAARAPWVATIDGDGQNDPGDIPRLFEAAQRLAADGAPVLICGHRRQRRDTWVKRLSSRLANAVRRRLLHDHTPDTGCGLKLFQRQAYLALPYFDHMHRFLPALMLRQGGRVASVEVRDQPRRHGTSHYGVEDRLWTGVVDLFGVWWLQRRARLPQSWNGDGDDE